MRIETHAGSPRHHDFFDAARRRLEAVMRILGIDAAFQHHARGVDIFLLKREFFAGGHAQLGLDQIDAGDHFRDRMLDLDAGVDFDKVKVALAIDDELDGAGVGVIGGFDERYRGLANALRTLGSRCDAGALFDDLLMPALHRAIAFPQVADIAVMVGDDLHLDVPRQLDVFLDVDGRIAEGGLGLGLRLLNGTFQDQVIGGDSHAVPTAASRGLDQDRKADLPGNFDRFALVGDQSVAAGNARHAGGASELAGLVLVSQPAPSPRSRGR